MANNKYAYLFKDITPEKWKEICDKYLTPDGIREYFRVNIPVNVIGYYNRKFNYKCPLSSNMKDERGNKYGKLTVIEYAGHDHVNHILWKCRCDCGQIVFKSGVDLRQASQRGMCCSCKDCIKKSTSERMWKDLTGQTINLLYVEERIGANSQGNVLYKCKCLNCGNEIIVSSSVLNGKKTQMSCGCIKSKGEYYINKYLNELHIKYKTQFKFSDCRNQIPLRFDFTIFDDDKIKCLIEFQGRQHYEVIDGYKDSKEDLELRQKRDEIKRQYCKEHNLRLVEIPYTDFSKLSPEYLEALINDV